MKYTQARFQVGGYGRAFSDGWEAAFGKRDNEPCARLIHVDGLSGPVIEPLVIDAFEGDMLTAPEIQAAAKRWMNAAREKQKPRRKRKR